MSGYFYPEVTPRAFRTTELARELAREGHDVTVVAPLSNDIDYTKIQDRSPLTLINLPKSWDYLKPSSNRIANLIIRAINRGLNLFFDYPTIELKYKVKNILSGLKGEHYDLLISIAMPHSVHWGTSKALKTNPGLVNRWIADCGDPYMGCKTDTFKKLFYFKYPEKDFCKRCNYIAVPIEEAIPSYYPEFHDKIRVIPQGFNIAKDLEETPIEVNNQVPTFVFAGSFIPGIRDPRPLLEWLTKRNSEFRFHIFTNNFGLIETYKNSLEDNLQLHKYVPRDELIGFMKKCDFLLNLENGTGVQSPSKLIDYTLCRRPILSLDSNNMDFSKIEEFLNGDYHQRMKPLDISKYDIRTVANQFLNLAK